MSDRTYPVVLDHVNGVIDAIRGGAFPVEFPVQEWRRPVDSNEKYIDPPYCLVRPMAAAAQFGGPITDTQTDVILRIQVLAVGNTQSQALLIADLVRPRMQRRYIIIPYRRVMDVRLMVVTGGLSRDDDLPTPFFYSVDIYELQTTPKTGGAI